MEKMQESCSMTPPMSPSVIEMETEEIEPSPPKRLHLQELDAGVSVCFACKGEVDPRKLSNSHPDSLLHRGQLDKLLSGTQSDNHSFQSVTTELFSFHFVPQLALQEEASRLFYLARLQYDRIESGMHTTACRQNIRHFFDYIQWYVIRCACGDRLKEVINHVLHHLSSLLQYIGHLADLPHHVILAPSLGQPPGSHSLFLVHLDIYWGILETLHLISVNHPGSEGLQICTLGTDSSEEYDMFSQCVHLVLSDVLSLAKVRHNKLSGIDYLSKSPFPCTCVQELCILLVHLLQHRQAKLAKQSFWGSFFPILERLINHKSEDGGDQVIDSTVFNLSAALECRDPVGLCWWILVHCTPLFHYDHFGIYAPGRTAEGNNYLVVITLLRKAFSLGQKLTENQFRVYMRCCVHLSHHWEPNTEVLVLLWDHFYKRLNEQFQVLSRGIQGLATESKTSLGLFEQCKSRCEPDSLRADESSFNLFLRLLAIHLNQPDRSGPNTAWKTMKGRFYSKFHSRRMQELSEVGLCNFTSLFLTLAYVTELEDVASKTCELYGSLTSRLGLNQRLVVWRGMFALVLIYINRGVDISVLADRILKNFHEVSSELSRPQLEMSRRHDLWQLVTMYMDSIQEVLECSQSLQLGEHKLISPNFKGVLDKCMENELRNVFSFLQAVLSRHRLLYKKGVHQGAGEVTMNHYRNLADRLWKGFYEFVRSHSSSQTPPSVLADVAAGFTFLSMDMPPSIHTGLKEDFQTSFLHFGCSENVQPSISCRYLAHLLANRPAMERLSLEVTNAEAYLVKAWFRCCWFILPGSQQMQELTRLILKLETMSSLFTEARLEPGESYETVVVQFTQALSSRYASLQGLKSKIEFQEHVKLYLGDVPKYLSQVLKNPATVEHLTPAYALAGQLVKNCGAFLYIKSRPDCLLPILLERLVFPRALLTQNKPMPPALLTAIRQHLDLFVQGLGQLDYRRDPYVQRKLKDIFIQFLSTFPVKPVSGSNVTRVHPLVASLSESCGRQVQEEASSFRRHVLELVSQEFIQMKGTVEISVGLNFLFEVINSTALPVEIAKDSLIVLSSVLELSLLNENALVQQPANNILQAMMSACQRCQEQVPVDQLALLVAKFVDRHVKVHQSKALKVLEPISVLHPSLLVRVIPNLTKSIKDGEAKRGVGVDKQLRIVYFSLLNAVGEKGQEEKSRLLQESS